MQPAVPGRSPGRNRCARPVAHGHAMPLLCPPRWAGMMTMDDASDTTDLALIKFGIGQPVPRQEDPKLLRGEGRYADDVNLAGQAYAVMVRSREAHGLIRRIDGAEARAMPGVLAVY